MSLIGKNKTLLKTIQGILHLLVYFFVIAFIILLENCDRSTGSILQKHLYIKILLFKKVITHLPKKPRA